MGIINDDMPRRESIAFFERAMRGHQRVRAIEKESPQIYKVTRAIGDNIYIYVTNLYTIGLTDYYEIIDEYPYVNAILTISNWNGYTMQAKEVAESENVGIYVVTEFLGALNWDEYVKYFKTDSKGRRIKFGRG